MKRQEVAFFGKISAAMTHDIRNVLAIIRESSGLMLDLLSLCEEGAFPYQQKFNKVLTGIQDQVNRGVELATHFNHFAHSMDHAVSDMDGNEVALQLAYLMQRFARLRKMQLVASVAEQPVAVRTDAFALYRMLGECVGTVLQHAADGDTITIAAGRSEGAVEFTILAPLADPSLAVTAAALPDELREVAECLQPLGGSLQWVSTSGGNGLSLMIPATPAVAA
jgi:signal transduction histidine kinase